MLSLRGGRQARRAPILPPKAIRVGEKLAIKGEIVGDEDVELAGRFEGTINVRGIVVIGEHAEVDADIVASTVVVGGTVRGNVTATGRVVVMPPGTLTGGVRARSIVVPEGAALRGAVEIDPMGETAKRGDNPKGSA
jgi:cytoskeletal protein CcmA (bactofilin family)